MSITRQSAELIAIKGLQYLAGDEEQLNRFLSLSGCEVSELRENVNSTEFQAGILEYFMGNEPTLLAFCADYSLEPQNVANAHEMLTGPTGAGVGEFV